MTNMETMFTRRQSCLHGNDTSELTQLAGMRLFDAGRTHSLAPFLHEGLKVLGIQRCC
jgi:hypothetical protein